MLSFNITSVFRLFAKGKTFVYMSPCLQKFDNSRTAVARPPDGIHPKVIERGIHIPLSGVERSPLVKVI